MRYCCVAELLSIWWLAASVSLTLICPLKAQAAEEPVDAFGTIRGRVSSLEDVRLRSARVVLNGGLREVSVNEVDGTFVIPAVPVGSYVLDVVHPQLSYSPVLVVVSTAAGTRKLKVRPFLYRASDDPKGVRLKYPLQLTPNGILELFEKSGSFDLSFFKRNPMFFILPLSIGAYLLLNRLHSSMDPEELRELTGGGLPEYHSPFESRLAALKAGPTEDFASRATQGGRSGERKGDR